MPIAYLRAYSAIKRLAKATHNSKDGKHGQSAILLAPYDSPQWLASVAFFLGTLRERQACTLSVYSNAGERISARHRVVLRALGVTQYLRLEQSDERSLSRFDREWHSACVSKRILLEARYRGLAIGLAVYETYLREGNPTVDLADSRLRTLFLEACALAEFWLDALPRLHISRVLLSHGCYFGEGILLEAARALEIETFIINPVAILRVSNMQDQYARLFESEPERFDRLPEATKRSMLTQARKSMLERFEGTPSLDAYYLTSSAFRPSLKIRGKTAPGESAAVTHVIAVHDFLDNPHGYGLLPFEDYWEWLDFVCTQADSSTMTWGLKVHPGANELEYQEANAFAQRYPKMQVVSPDLSWQDLIRQGLRTVVTCHGSVALELPALGVHVISCGVHPGMAYELCSTARSPDELATQIRVSQQGEGRVTHVVKFEEAWAMSFQYRWIDNLVYPSFRQLESSLIGASMLERERRSLIALVRQDLNVRFAQYARGVGRFLGSSEDFLTLEDFVAEQELVSDL